MARIWPEVEANRESLVEIINTAYGPMMVPRFDSIQTYHLKTSGRAPTHDLLEVIKEEINKCDRKPVFIDIGANIGVYSVALSPLCKLVFAFEPDYFMFNILCANVALSGLDNIYTYNFMLGKNFGMASQPKVDYSKYGNFGNITWQPEYDSININDNCRSYAIIRPVDACFEQIMFTENALMKIDVEGMEMEVLEGAKMFIGHYKPVLFIEHTTVGIEKLKFWADMNKYDTQILSHDVVCRPQ